MTAPAPQCQPMSVEEQIAILQARGDLAVQNRNYWHDEAERRAGHIAALVKALEGVRAIISEAAMTGFNYKDGDWAERLFASQATTSAALKDITK